MYRALCALTLLPVLLGACGSESKHAKPKQQGRRAKPGKKAAPSTARIQQAIKQFGHSDPNQRIAAAEWLAKQGPAAKAAVPALIKGFEDSVEKVRIRSHGALSKIGKPAISALLDALKDGITGDGEVQFRAYMALANMTDRNAPAVPTLIEYMNTGDADLRLYSAQIVATSHMAEEQTMPTLIKLLRDPDEEVRDAAGETMSTWARIQEHGPNTFPAALRKNASALRAELGNKTPAVRYTVREVLIHLKPMTTELANQILAGLDDPNRDVRIRMAVTVGQLGSFARPALPKLRGMLKNLKRIEIFAVKLTIKQIEQAN